MVQEQIAGTVTCTHEDGTQETMQVSPGGTLTMTSTGRVKWDVEAAAGETVSYARRMTDGVPAPRPLALLDAPDKYEVVSGTSDGLYSAIPTWRFADGRMQPLTQAVGASPVAGEFAWVKQRWIIPRLDETGSAFLTWIKSESV